MSTRPLEKEISEHEEKIISRISMNLSYDEVTSVSERLLFINSMLEQKEMRWLELSELA